MGTKPNWGRGIGMGLSSLGRDMFRYGMTKDRQDLIEKERRAREQAYFQRDENRNEEWDRRRGIMDQAAAERAEESAARSLANNLDLLDARDPLYDGPQFLDMDGQSSPVGQGGLRLSHVRRKQQDMETREYRDEMIRLRNDGLELERIRAGQGQQRINAARGVEPELPRLSLVDAAIDTYLPEDKIYKDGTLVRGDGSLVGADEKSELIKEGILPPNFAQAFSGGFRDSTGTGRWGASGDTADAVFSDMLADSIDPDAMGMGDWSFDKGSGTFSNKKKFFGNWKQDHRNIREFVDKEILPTLKGLVTPGLKGKMINAALLKKYGITHEQYRQALDSGTVGQAIDESGANLSGDALDLILQLGK